MKLQTKRKCLNNSLGNLRVLILTHHISIAFCGVGDSLRGILTLVVGTTRVSHTINNNKKKQQQQQKTTKEQQRYMTF